MFISSAYAQTTAPAGGDMSTVLIGLLPYLLIFVVFYFLLIRPQQQARKRHLEMVANVKKGDVVVTTGGLIGKVKSVADDELRVELAPNVDVRVVRGTIAEVRSKTDPAPANDSKPS
ncbi:MAG: preprotein translocase subunit YajC [Phycisphaerales bacterium]|nr:preprotein translocase subunit YajC [Hyphomonadaceae bacterium]